MSDSRQRRIRRLLGDLRRSESRGDAIRRVRRRAGGSAGGGRAPSTAGSKPDAWYVGQWSGLAGAVFGPAGPSVSADARSLDAALAPDAVKAAGRHRAEATFTASIARGEPLVSAVYRAVDELAAAVEWHAAWSLAEGVGRLPGGADASAIGHAVLLHRRRQFARAWTVARAVDDSVLAANIPLEAVDAALADGSAGARERALAISTPSDTMSAATLVDLAGRWLVFGERERSAALMAALRRRPSIDLDVRRRAVLSSIDRWLERRSTTVPAGSIPVAILGDETPDVDSRSGDLGDDIQTLGLLGNLARLQGVTFTGDDGLGEVVSGLKEQVRPELRVPGIGGAIHLVRIDRDVSHATDVPPGTWMFAFGSQPRRLFDLREDFPYPQSIRPLFVSYHVDRPESLTDEAVAYLRGHAPIGCRDWNTVFLLLSAGVDAFFSGCLSTTVDALYPSREAAYRGRGAVGVIDLPSKAAGRGAKDIRVSSLRGDDAPALTASERLREAFERLGADQRDLERAVTSQLHAFLPLITLGVPTELRATAPGALPLAGLSDLQPSDTRLVTMRDDLRDLLAAMVERILSGAGEEEVYAAWRERTADQVADAKARFGAPGVEPTTSIDVAAAVATSRAGMRALGPHDLVDPATVTDLVIAYDRNLLWPAAVLLESVVRNASGPVRLWILGRGLAEPYQDWLAAAFPTVAMTFVPCDRITYGAAGRPRRIPIGVTISTLDRLIVPVLLDDVPRVVYLDIDTLMLSDIGRLGEIDLHGHPVAARDSNVSETSEWQRAARGLREPVATDLRRRLAARDGFGHAALNAGVMVLDLDRMRRDGFTATSLAQVELYGFHDQDAMLAYVGPDREVLDPRWNALPVLEDIDDPWLIHWASFGKPWDRRLTVAQDRWHSYAEPLRERAGDPPVGDPTRVRRD